MRPARRMVWLEHYGVRTPYSVWQVEVSPAPSDGRPAADEPERARSCWRCEEPAVFA